MMIDKARVDFDAGAAAERLHVLAMLDGMIDAIWRRRERRPEEAQSLLERLVVLDVVRGSIANGLHEPEASAVQEAGIEGAAS